MTSIYTLARDIIRAADHTDPDLLAKELVEAIPEGEEREYLLSLARPFINEALNAYRYSARRAPSGRSKADSVRGHWQQLMDSREYIPDTGTWVRLGDATLAEVRSVAAHRQQQADENAAAAARYGALAEAMKRYRVEIVSELAEEVVIEALT
jgi:chemotaxis regulatin CheY-phosphate phosphatase CheZ